MNACKIPHCFIQIYNSYSWRYFHRKVLNVISWQGLCSRSSSTDIHPDPYYIIILLTRPDQPILHRAIPTQESSNTIPVVPNTYKQFKNVMQFKVLKYFFRANCSDLHFRKTNYLRKVDYDSLYSSTPKKTLAFIVPGFTVGFKTLFPNVT